jgi:hypothetical protein
MARSVRRAFRRFVGSGFVKSRYKRSHVRSSRREMRIGEGFTGVLQKFASDAAQLAAWFHFRAGLGYH